MLILTRNEIADLLTMQDALDAVEEGFARLTKGEVVMPQRAATPIGPYGGLHLSMPAYVEGDPGTLTVKIVTVYGENPARFRLPMIQGVLLLHDARNGNLLSIMDAEYVTMMRTGAASGVATKYLARPDAQTLTLFGAGAQAGAQLEAVCAVRDVRRAFVVTHSGRKDAEFSERMSGQLDIDVVPMRDVRSAVEAADVICTATSSAEPLFDGAWVRPGTHINAVGAYTRTMRELDAVTVQRSRVFVDAHAAAQTEAGDILVAIAEGALGYDHVAGELGDLVLGTTPGRIDSDQITLFKSVGLAMQDAVTAARVYALATETDAGRVVRL
ncbi:MAG: ornithine cyclodeaminase family protein [Caldilineaceae bacterium]